MTSFRCLFKITSFCRFWPVLAYASRKFRSFAGIVAMFSCDVLLMLPRFLPLMKLFTKLLIPVLRLCLSREVSRDFAAFLPLGPPRFWFFPLRLGCAKEVRAPNVHEDRMHANARWWHAFGARIWRTHQAHARVCSRRLGSVVVSRCRVSVVFRLCVMFLCLVRRRHRLSLLQSVPGAFHSSKHTHPGQYSLKK